MKRLIATTALALMVAVPAYAAEEDVRSFETVEKSERGDIYASELIGMRIYATEDDFEEKPYQEGAEADWDDIGEVDDVILTQDGKVKAVVLGIGGFLGIGERDIAVKMSSLNRVRESDDRDDFFLVVNTNKDTLMNAAAYDRRVVNRQAEDKQAEDKQAKDKAAEDKQAEDKAAEDKQAEDASDPKKTAEKREMAADQKSEDVRLAAPAVERDGYTEASKKDLTAEMIQGAPVYGPNDEEVGEVDKLLMNDNGQVDRVVIDVGGFLGVGERPIAVSMDEVKILKKDDGDEVRVFIDATKSQLEKKPEYKS